MEIEGLVSEAARPSRVRMSLSLTAKGLVQWELTSEFPSVEESRAQLALAVDQVKALLKEKGLEEAHS
jgi:hypothetical protein